jgi:hypothetical protein
VFDGFGYLLQAVVVANHDAIEGQVLDRKHAAVEYKIGIELFAPQPPDNVKVYQCLNVANALARWDVLGIAP